MNYPDSDTQEILKLIKKLDSRVKQLETKNTKIEKQCAELEKSIQNLTKRTDPKEISRALARDFF
jgi:phage shock protein A